MSVSFPFTRGRLIVPPVEMGHSFPAWPKMALDTGARATIIVPRIARELGFEPEKLEPTATVISATGTVRAALLRIKSISILGLEVTNVRALCHALPPRLELDGILGLNLLRHFDIEISHTNETVTMERRRE